MRLDLFLKASRLCLRRSIAQEMCDAGIVRVNGVVAKPSKPLNISDTIEIRRRNRILTVAVTSIPDTKQVARADASSLYSIVSDETTKED